MTTFPTPLNDSGLTHAITIPNVPASATILFGIRVGAVNNGASAATITGVANSAAATPVPGPSPFVDQGNNTLYAYQIKAATTGTQTVTFTTSNSVTCRIIPIIVTGAVQSQPIDKSSSNGGATGNANSGNFGVTFNNELIVGFVEVSDGALTITPGLGFVGQPIVDGKMYCETLQLGAGGGNYSVSATINPPQIWAAMGFGLTTTLTTPTPSPTPTASAVPTTSPTPTTSPSPTVSPSPTAIPTLTPWGGPVVIPYGRVGNLSTTASNKLSINPSAVIPPHSTVVVAFHQHNGPGPFFSLASVKDDSDNNLTALAGLPIFDGLQNPLYGYILPDTSSIQSVTITFTGPTRSEAVMYVLTGTFYSSPVDVISLCVPSAGMYPTTDVLTPTRYNEFLLAFFSTERPGSISLVGNPEWQGVMRVPDEPQGQQQLFTAMAYGTAITSHTGQAGSTGNGPWTAFGVAIRGTGSTTPTPTPTASSDIIDPARKIVWQGSVGIKTNTVVTATDGIPDTSGWPIFRTLTPNNTDDYAQIQSAMNACPAGSVVKLLGGTWKIVNGPLDFTGAVGKVLRGTLTGTPTKIMLLNNNGGVGFANVREQVLSYHNTQVLLSVDAVKGASSVTCSSVPSWITPGNLYWVSQLDGASVALPVNGSYVSHYSYEDGTDIGAGLRFQHGAWYEVTGEERSMGQLNKCLSKTSTTITFETPLFWAYSTALSAAVNEAPYQAVTGTSSNMGFEDFILDGSQHACIAAQNCGDIQTFNFQNADSCWIRNVTINKQIGRNGVHSDFSYRLLVDHSWINDSNANDSGQGYGIALYNCTTGCLIQNSILEKQHAGMDLSYSAGGNVFGYNVVYPGVGRSNATPGWATHGVHNWMNLAEGNYFREYVGFDMTHGSGSHQTIFRNQIPNDGTGQSVHSGPITINQYNRYNNVVGNILGNNGFSYVAYETVGGGDGVNQTCLPDVSAIYEIGCGAQPGQVNDTIATSQISRILNYDFYTHGIHDGSGWSTGSLANSYYLPSKPSWFGFLSWPPFSPAVSTTTEVAIPAGFRHNNNGNDPGPIAPKVAPKPTSKAKHTVGLHP